jgi:DNA-binding CsgD family transcriptional regulator
VQPRDGIDDPGHAPWAHLLAEALVALGRSAEARAHIARHEAIAAERGRHAATARLALARGRLEHDETAFLQALETIEPLGRPYDHALIELGYGEFLRRDGRRRAAADQLRDARERLAALDAAPALARCERELEACGLTPAARLGDGDPHRLTPQERAVARLAGERMSNREIAAELMLSVKTVEHHLTRVYAKLGVRSRADLAP